MTNSTQNSPSFHLFIQANSPGEISAWVKPIAITAKQYNPNIFITLYLVPCQYATKKEADVAKTISEIDEIIPVNKSLLYLFSLKKLIKKSKNGAILYLGGDPFYSSRMSSKTGFPAFAYTEHQNFPTKAFTHVFFKHKDGDLMAANSQIQHFERNLIFQKYSLNPKKDYCLIFPGSRPEHFKAFFKLCLDTVTEIHKSKPYHFIFCISPYISDDLLNESQPDNNTPNITYLRGNSLELLHISTLMISLPGTNTAEAMYMHCPMYTLCPLNQPKLLILDGLLGLIVKLPLIGSLILFIALSILKKKTKFASLPNKLKNEKIVPEFIGIIKPKEQAHIVIKLLENKEKLLSIKERLKQMPISPTHQAIVKKILKSNLHQKND